MAIGEAFLSAFLQVLFDRLASKNVIDFIRGHDTENDLKRLKTTLRKVKAVLNDAEDKQFKNEDVKIWLDELKDAAYDAEDVLDEFATEALRQKLEAESDQSSSNQVWSFLHTSLNPSVFLFNAELECKIKEITERFDELANKRFELGLEEVVAGSSRIVRETSSVVDESRVYGRDYEKEKIIELLLKYDPCCDDKISVIPIIGMGGIGKTTLAQIVYNDGRLEKHFDLKAWVCVSEEFDVKRITRSIIKSVSTSKSSDSDDLNRVQVKLMKALNGKKFLIVLDDVWSKQYSDWDVLQNPFRVGAPGSKIIVTTRIRDVALMMGIADNHCLEHLSNDDCWSVFAEHAFGSRIIERKPNLVVIGKRIVEKCKGLPLAAKTLGGLLRSKLEEDKWEDILNSKMWELPENETEILPALKLSYHHLPSHLKRCFAYCSILPKNYEFEEMRLVLLWMAEGLVQQPNGRKQMEDVGVEYFRDLLSMSFFQHSSTNRSLFVMHDLINDLAQWVAGETCFKLEDMLEGEKQSRISKRARHSSYVGRFYTGVQNFEVFDEVECLRTFLPLLTPKGSYLTNYVPLNLLPKLRCLRVLSLSGYHITELPNSIGDLKHIRYLNLSDTKIKSLPESISSLYNLQTLILRDCSHLKKLPTKMRNLMNLRLLDITNAYLIEEMPLGVGKLTSLRKLSNFMVGSNSGSGIGELMNLNFLGGTLHISSLENVINAWDAREAYLQDKQDLDGLIIEWNSIVDDSRNERVEKQVLDMLQPQKMLKELTIKCYGGANFPMWIGDSSFCSMVFLRLENCEKCSSLPPLGQLPSLKDLCIKGMIKVKSVGLEFFGEGCIKPFPSLKTLSFEDMEEWKDWFHSEVNGQVEAFPCLCELSIKRCPILLKKLPKHLPSLEKLFIYGCPQLTISISSLPKLCEFNIQECKEVVHRSMLGRSSLKFMAISNISKLMCPTDGFIQRLPLVEDLVIVGCMEMTSLWQNEAGLLQHLTSLGHLKIEGCPKFVSLVVEEAEQQQLMVPCRLESLELNWCDNLEKLQGLHNLTSLRELIMVGCPRLQSFPEIGSMSMLGELMIEDCDSITSIARGQLPSTLKKLEVKRCENLLSLVEEVEGSTCTATTSLHNKSNSSSASFLNLLSISHCPSLKCISSRGELPATLKYLQVQSCPKLESVAERLHNNMSVEHIWIFDCESLKSLPEGLHNLIHLSYISVRKCPSLVSFPDGGLPSIKRLHIENCSKLESVVERFQNNTSLESIYIFKCESLKSLPEDLHNLSHLCKFEIYRCPSLVSFPEGGLPATSLRQLWIEDCENLEALPRRIHHLTSLQKLEIISCPGIVCFPEDGFPVNLMLLSIKDLKISKPLFDWGLHRLTSLTWLTISGPCPDLVSFPEKEKGMILPTSLRKLTIRDFPNLEYLSSKVFKNLTSLEELRIYYCPKLKSSLEGLPPSLLQLYIWRCPLLKQQCKKDQGRYWLKIVHIPYVSIDGRLLSDPED